MINHILVDLGNMTITFEPVKCLAVLPNLPGQPSEIEFRKTLL